MRSPAELRLVRWFSSLPGWPVPPDDAAARVLEIIAEPDAVTMRALLTKALGSTLAVDEVAKLLQNPTDEMFDALTATDKLWRELDSRQVFTVMASAILKPAETTTDAALEATQPVQDRDNA